MMQSLKAISVLLLCPVCTMFAQVGETLILFPTILPANAQILSGESLGRLRLPFSIAGQIVPVSEVKNITNGAISAVRYTYEGVSEDTVWAQVVESLSSAKVLVRQNIQEKSMFLRLSTDSGDPDVTLGVEAYKSTLDGTESVVVTFFSLSIYGHHVVPKPAE